jgi:hypothetical protein
MLRARGRCCLTDCCHIAEEGRLGSDIWGQEDGAGAPSTEGRDTVVLSDGGDTSGKLLANIGSGGPSRLEVEGLCCSLKGWLLPAGLQQGRWPERPVMEIWWVSTWHWKHGYGRVAVETFGLEAWIGGGARRGLMVSASGGARHSRSLGKGYMKQWQPAFAP